MTPFVWNRSLLWWVFEIAHGCNLSALCLLYTSDNGKTFTKYEGNPIITSTVPDFRDPHMFWNEDIKKWNMICLLYTSGNQAIDDNAQFGLYVVDYGLDRVTSTAYDLFLQGSGTFPSGYRATQLANPNLKWEAATQYNVGLDYTLFGNTRCV